MAATNEVNRDRLEILSLPREIRDQIYFEALLSPTKPPESEETWATKREGRFLRDRGGYWHQALIDPQNPCQGLLACNRQVRRESKELLARRSPLDFHLNLWLEVHATWKWIQFISQPTWTLYPDHPTQYIRELKVGVRLYTVGGNKTFSLPEPFHYHPNSRHPYNYQYVLLPVLQLVSRFLHQGPHFAYNNLKKRDIYVETLKIDVSCRDVQGCDTPERPSHLIVLLHEIFANLRDTTSRLADSGLFSGQISRIIISAGDETAELKSAVEKGIRQPEACFWDRVDIRYK